MPNPNEEKLHQLALSLIPSIGPGTFRSIIGFCGSATDFFKLTTGKASKIYGVGPKLVDLLKNKEEYIRQAHQVLSDCQKKQIDIHTLTDKTFPQRLKNIDDSPVVLFTKGKIDLNPLKTIGIVGTRNASSYGKSVTKKIIEEIQSFSPTIISGLAYGIDIEAHKEALLQQLPTLAVLGSPANKIYPSLHKDIALQMMENGGMVSEYLPHENMHPSNFPKRNRIIAGLSDALIVVEAAAKGGALITAEIAYSYNKEVFAVPGNLQSKNSQGCNELIRSLKASIYTGSKDIVEALSWEIGPKNPSSSLDGKLKKSIGEFSEDEQKIIQSILEHQEIEIDKLSNLLKLEASALASSLLNLEFEGIIKTLPGKKFTLI
jgi:DNA processing protein